MASSLALLIANTIDSKYRGKHAKKKALRAGIKVVK